MLKSLTAFLMLAVCALNLSAQPASPVDAKPAMPRRAAAQAPLPAQPAPPPSIEQMILALGWLPPNATGNLAGKATFRTSAAYTFLGTTDTDKFLKLNGNPPTGTAVTIAPTRGDWFGILKFADEGYVKDDEKIDANALLKALQKNNEQSNEAKRKQGYQTLTLQGWALPPRYDRQNQRLEWGTLFNTEDNSQVVNVSTRILGRSGYTSAVLVTTPATLDADLADFKTALNDFQYVAGERYSEWRSGDKVAAYGLGALVLGGAAAAASKKGGFKLIGVGVLAALGFAWAAVKRLFSRS